jgi:hypothetical protein
MGYKDRLTSLIQSLLNATSPLADRLKVATPLKLSGRTIEAYRAVLLEKVNHIDRLPSKYRREALEAVWNGVMRGYDEGFLSLLLSEQLGFSPARARQTAKMQCRMARAVIENAQRQESGLLNAVWVHHPRCHLAGHREFSGRRYTLRLGATFNDKPAWPGGEPDCHCSAHDVHTMRHGGVFERLRNFALQLKDALHLGDGSRLSKG